MYSEKPWADKTYIIHQHTDLSRYHPQALELVSSTHGLHTGSRRYTYGLALTLRDSTHKQAGRREGL